MRLGEIVQPHLHTVFHRLVGQSIWSREAEEFSPVDLDVLFALVRRYATAEQAQKACDMVVLKLKAAILDDRVSYVQVEQKSYIRHLIMQKQFDTALEKFSPVRADAVRFALEMHWSIEDAVVLERRDIKHYLYDMNERAAEIFKRQPISMFKRTVFWEVINNEPRVLVSLRHQVAQTFKSDWEVILKQYDRVNGTLDSLITKEDALNAIIQRSQ